MAQSTTPAGQQRWQDVFSHLGAEGSIADLTIGYRVPEPILTVANRLLPLTGVDTRASRSVRADGAPPAWHRADVRSLASDVARVVGWVQVRHATGAERYLTFGGEVENPAEGEVVFADADGNAHARRWTNRQSGLSAVHDGTRAVLIVAEAMHDTARADVESLLTALSAEIAMAWQPPAATAILGPSEPEFGF